jgi:hypothetical protein
MDRPKEERSPMPRRLTTLALVLAIAGLGAPLALAADGPWAGRWHWNEAESTKTPGEAPPRDITLVIESATPAHVQWSLTITDPTGAQHQQSFSGSGDGKPSPVGGAPAGTTGALTVTPTHFDSVYSNSDGSADRSSCTLSADRRKMTCRGADSDGKGHSIPYTDVYDRQ